jgi:hypothetical protein
MAGTITDLGRFLVATFGAALVTGIAGFTFGLIPQARSDLAGGVRNHANSLNGKAMFALSGGIR